jgi:two-component system OmpR family sensor kinase
VFRRLRGAYRRTRLGTRLALGIGVLSLVVFAVVGTALTTYMKDYLERQLGEQMKLVQVTQSKDAQAHGTVQRRPYYGWFTAVYDVKGHTAVLREPADVPADTAELTAAAQALPDGGDAHLLRTAHIAGEGTYKLRACEVDPGVVLVTAAPMQDMQATVRQLITVQVVTFALALLGLVVLGRTVLRRGLKPFSDMAHTARGITSHNLTGSARLGAAGGAGRGRARRTRGRGTAHRVQHHAGAHRRRARRPHRGRAAAAPVRRGRLARAAYAPDVGTRLRGPLPVRRRQRARGT